MIASGIESSARPATGPLGSLGTVGPLGSGGPRGTLATVGSSGPLGASAPVMSAVRPAAANDGFAASLVERSFAPTLNAARARAATSAETRALREQATEAAEQLVATAFIQPMLDAAFEPAFSEGGGPFDPGAGERTFRPLLNQHLADAIVHGSNVNLVDAIVDAVVPPAARTAAPPAARPTAPLTAPPTAQPTAPPVDLAARVRAAAAEATARTTAAATASAATVAATAASVGGTPTASRAVGAPIALKQGVGIDG